MPWPLLVDGATARGQPGEGTAAFAGAGNRRARPKGHAFQPTIWSRAAPSTRLPKAKTSSDTRNTVVVASIGKA